MKNLSSYNVSEISENVQNEIKRLNGQINLFWDKEFILYRKNGLKNGIRVLEVGSGPGFLSEKILSEFDDIVLYSLEIDDVLIEFARKNCSHIDRNKIVHGSILNCNLEEDFFDLIIIRLVLEHLDEPLKAVKKAYELLKKGGKIIVVDNDFAFHLSAYPSVSNLSKLYKAYCNARIKQGGNPYIGRELPSILKKTGFSVEAFETISVHSEIVGDDAFKELEGLGIAVKLLKDGFLSSADLVSIIKEWNLMINSRNHGILRQLFLSVGKKTTENQ